MMKIAKCKRLLLTFPFEVINLASIVSDPSGRAGIRRWHLALLAAKGRLVAAGNSTGHPDR